MLVKHPPSTLDKRHLNPKSSQKEEAPHDHPSASKHPLSQPVSGYWDYSRIHHAAGTSPKTPLRRRNEGMQSHLPPLCCLGMDDEQWDRAVGVSQHTLLLLSTTEQGACLGKAGG